jgi:diadenosine tetraphosphate (Ap4A) HIT family hydrolase
MKTCPLCNPANETVLWRDDRCRVILVDDADYPGFCRVIWGGHVKEMTDLTEPERVHLMAVVFATEEILRETLQPAKVNLASPPRISRFGGGGPDRVARAPRPWTGQD